MDISRLEAPQAIRTIFFDAGFTLLRTSPSLVEVCQDVCRREGVHLDLESISQRLPEAEAYFIEAIKANRRTWASEEAIVHFWSGYYKALLRPCIAEDNEALLELCVQEIIKDFRPAHPLGNSIPTCCRRLRDCKAKTSPSASSRIGV